MPWGERMARSSATRCCRYFLYKRAAESATTARQTAAIAKYLKICFITSQPPMRKIYSPPVRLDSHLGSSIFND